MNNLKKHYTENIVPKAKKEFKLSSPLAVPRMEKVVINIGTGKIASDDKTVEMMENTLQRITGQKPIATTARKSISNFKLRKGMKIGLAVTLRGPRMYDFIEKLINITLPRVRDFRGLRPEAIDAQGNLNIGIREHNAFAEVGRDEIERLHGLQISVRMTGNDRERSEYILRELGFPFAKKGEVEKRSTTDNELSPKAKVVNKENA